MSESTPALGETTTAIAFDHTLTYAYMNTDPKRVVASVEPADSGDSVDEAVNEERHG